MTADPLPQAARVREAKRAGRVDCGHYIRPGRVIVQRGGRWTCLRCALATIRADTTPPPGVRRLADRP